MFLKTDDQALEMLELFSKTRDLVCIATKEGYFKNFNPTVPQTLEYSAEELFEHPISFFMHPDDRQRTAISRKQLLEGSDLLNFQNRYVTRSGKIVWLEWTSVYIPEKQIVFAIAKNITVNKEKELSEAEAFRKVTALASHFKSTNEADRKSIAHQLHENLAQQATAVKLNLTILKECLPTNDNKIEGRLEQAIRVTDEMIGTMRQLSYDLSPSILDEAGFPEVMQWLCKEFHLKTKISCEFFLEEYDQTLSKELQIDLFRISQKRLNQIARNQANAASINLRQSASQLELEILDDAVPEINQTGPEWTAIRERVLSFNGDFVFEAGEPNRMRVAVKSLAI